MAELSRPADARFHLWPRSKSGNNPHLNEFEPRYHYCTPEGGKKGTGARQCPVVSVNLNGSERVVLDDDGKANVCYRTAVRGFCIRYSLCARGNSGDCYIRIGVPPVGEGGSHGSLGRGQVVRARWPKILGRFLSVCRRP